MERSQIIDIKQFNTFYDINLSFNLVKLNISRKIHSLLKKNKKMKIYFSYFKVLLIIIAFLKMTVKEYSILKIKNIF